MDLKVFLIHYKVFNNASGNVNAVDEGNWILKVDTTEESVTDAIVEKLKELAETSEPNNVVITNVCLIESIPVKIALPFDYVATFDGDVAIAPPVKPSLPTFL